MGYWISLCLGVRDRDGDACVKLQEKQNCIHEREWERSESVSQCHEVGGDPGDRGVLRRTGEAHSWQLLRAVMTQSGTN